MHHTCTDATFFNKVVTLQFTEEIIRPVLVKMPQY